MSHRCTAIYTRPAALCDPDEERLVRCTFLAGHPRRCSFFALQTQDEVDLAKQADEDDVPPDLRALLAAITAGQWDPYIEAILAVTHNRKRTTRHVPGFHPGGMTDRRNP